MFLPAVIFCLLIQLEPGLKAVAQPDSLPIDCLSSSVSSSQETGPLVTQDFLGLFQAGENVDASPCRSELLEQQGNSLNIETRKRDDQVQGKQGCNQKRKIQRDW
jgi:hypothetical protein